MNIYEAINTRRTIRDFDDRQVDAATPKQNDVSARDKIHMDTWKEKTK